MQNIKKYQIIQKIYESDNSLVYRAILKSDNQPVILKLLKENYPTPSELTRYKQEYEITRSLSADCIVKAYDLQRYENSLIMILEDFGGESLKFLISKHQFSLEEFLKIAIKTTESLAAIHSANIIHKDINPSNIVYNPETEQLKIIDFGISTRLSQENPTLCNPNQLEGTIAYISPEQTGRMNRSIDYRTDFYSLGISFYELLTQQLPFESTDAMELVHCHIAKQPVPPHERTSGIPFTVSNIVMKLLAKTAEERYQSAWGIKADLETCLDQLETLGKISQFHLGCYDISDKFHITQKLYGRELEVTQLLTAFERVSQGSTEMMVISGYSGIGKSLLVNEVHKLIARQGGYFIEGKFDQLKRDIPYAAFSQAFHELIRQLLAEPEARLQIWQQQILEALGTNGQVIANIIPKIEELIGKQLLSDELQASESQNRFNLLFQKFITIFGKKEHPLVIFLDDLQWADLPSLKLIELLMKDEDSQYILMIGAYRDNEVSPLHPLIQTLEQIKRTETTVQQIALQPLEINDINQLIADSLSCSLKYSKPLADLVNKKTQGNPFFLTQFLQALYKENLLLFNSNLSCWQWNIEEIERTTITDNVVDLMVSKIEKLDGKTQNILKLAACIGNKFSLKTLSSINKKSQNKTAYELQPALQEGLIVPLSDDYKIPLLWSQEEMSSSSSSRDSNFIPKYPELIIYKFLHDRVQQAAYTLITAADKKKVHLEVGFTLLKNTTQDKLEENIFDIVNQIDQGYELISDVSKKYELAQLNLKAGKKAKVSTAYGVSLKYLDTALKILPSNSWLTQYKLAFEVYVETLESLYLNSKFSEVEELYAITLQQTKSTLDKIKVYLIKIQSYFAQFHQQKAIDIAREALTEIGVNIPQEESEIENQIKEEQELLKILLTDKVIDDLASLKPMSDPYKIAVISILQQIVGAAIQVNFRLYILVILIQINLCLKYGNPIDAANIYSLYGMILCGVIEDFDLGYKFGQISLKLLDKFNNYKSEAFVTHLYYGFIWHWKESIRNKIAEEKLLSGFQRGIDTGNHEFASYVSISYCIVKIFRGDPLEDIRQTCKKFTDIIKKIQQTYSFYYIKICNSIALNLVEGYNKSVLIIGNSEKEEENYLNVWLHDKNEWLLFIAYLTKTIVYFYFKQYEQALAHQIKASQYWKACTAYLPAPQYNFYSSLTLLASCKKSNTRQKKQLLQQVKENQKVMAVWMSHCPNNFKNKYDLVAAEEARVLGKKWEAEELYEQSIQGAKQYEFIHEEALAYERAAEFYLSIGRKEIGQLYLKNAHHCYTLWGAKAKVEQLELEYPQLFLAASKSISASNLSTTSSLSSSKAEILDITTVIKASQVLGGEIKLDKLLENLMKTMIENAGAQKGYLILNKQGNWVIEAEGSVDSNNITILQSIPIDFVAPDTQIPLLSDAIINYVARTHENVVLNNATDEGQFTRDPYITITQPKSILCTALLNQARLSGILYLENNLTTGAFTSDRVEVLKILSAQAAISIENSRLYRELENYSHTLEEKVEARTQELQEKNQDLANLLQKLKATQAQIVAQEKLASLGALTAGIAHEIKNPLNFVNNFAELSIELAQELQEEIDSQKDNLDPETVESIEEILDTLSQNAKKINEHGKRADNIVRGMLVHSRGQTGQRQLCDINALLADAVNLATHGMHAKDPSFNIVIKADYDRNLGQVDIIPQSINRAFINLINNACYAAHKKRISLQKTQDSQSEGFLPTLSVITKDLGTRVEIRIRDNGEGIPQELLEHIFNPFFTTKPPGEGTGLGLSITHDIIVQQHQGEIKIDTLVADYTDVIIILPKILSEKN
ncbi:AAA family ATPase [Aetokthonos hydrillicola Thurmond2011]|jgi:predicted ATPase/signal transduction histidine kinase|uniref:histidine kinase n=1 Tax=Aetokthonos hydrillicola Thurmond2011 TaxID=2712845 RepID=A0AAP5I4X7_9CYAN|nr:ATP-binding sensor histidine kinase [Aetokthonos hydrillicola]MBO3459796.1 AAA family ATPase [Aetokthonos hydrillicola CCALA 1050]MBW4584559.1 AAA family ATPase [Aetokthonos hydrillicola CCALA 1050]MDR9895103.1 AAA family ATPase [Aetokthonos hydrillicola Thurmond2011]